MMLRSVACCCGMLLWLVACAGKPEPVQPQTVTRVYDKHGVTVDEMRDEHGVQRFGMDGSDGGAVLCGRMLYIMLYNDLRQCNDPRVRSALPELRTDIDRIDQFIVANTPDHPGLKAQRTDTQAELERYDGRRQVFRTCERIAATPDAAFHVREEYRQGVKKMLAVPRLPVMNPCL